MARLFLILLLLLLLSCESQDDQSALACDHFRNVAGDISDGVLTDAEIRAKLQEIDDNASIATPAIQSAARRMLAGITSGTPDDVLDAMGDMDTACRESGH